MHSSLFTKFLFPKIKFIISFLINVWILSCSFWYNFSYISSFIFHLKSTSLNAMFSIDKLSLIIKYINSINELIYLKFTWNLVILVSISSLDNISNNSLDVWISVRINIPLRLNFSFISGNVNKYCIKEISHLMNTNLLLK